MSPNVRTVGLIVMVAMAGLAGCIGDDSGSDDVEIETTEPEMDGSNGGDTGDGGGGGTATPGATPGATATPGGGGGDLITDTPEPIQAGGMELVISEIRECGLSCREVDLVVNNKAGEDRTNVELDMDLEADGDVVWSDVVALGDIQQGGSVSETITVDLSSEGARKVGDNDWKVTLVADINSDQDTATATKTLQF